MARLFRNIRMQNLIDNKFKRYFLYAFGEILLLVMGILLALQINNWNQENKIKKRSTETLLALKSSFLIDLADLEESKFYYNRSKKSMSVILESIDKDLPYNDSLKVHFFHTTFVFGTNELNPSVYESLKSNGINTLLNKEIRDQLIYVFEISNSYLGKWEGYYINIILDAEKNILNLLLVHTILKNLLQDRR